MKHTIVLLLLACTVNAYAQYPKVDIPGSEVRKITSSIVAGQEYELQILLPGGHKTSTKKYPVIYLMDSQWDFPMVKSLYGQHYYDGFVPELIVVGVTWGGINPNPDSLRARDYTPTKEARSPQSGGADNFLSFMKNELFPFIESNYKADNNNRTLMGCSLGGLFTLYTLFTQPDLFTGYAAASPAVGWDREVLYKYEKDFAEKKLSKPVRVYMTIGDVERSRPAYERFAAQMTSRNYASVSLKSKILENTGHSGTKSETFGRGIQYIFEKPKLNLDAAVLNKYVGLYQSPNGNKIELKNEEGKLALYFSPTNKYLLYTASETGFYSNSEFFNIEFIITPQKIEGFELNRYGSSQFIKKTN
ncbi:MAG TPA: alpha/beta hydrolase-fold protein [Chitinophagaceae bacterium]